MARRDEIKVDGGQNLKEGLTAAKRLGCIVENRRRTGELVVTKPGMDGRVILNGRRKDSPRHLTAFLRRVMENLDDKEGKTKEKEAKQTVTTKTSRLKDVDVPRCASRMKSILNDQEITQVGAAEKTGISQKTINKWAGGKTKPRLATIKAFCDAFGVNDDWLLWGNGRMYVSGKGGNGTTTTTTTTTKPAAESPPPSPPTTNDDTLTTGDGTTTRDPATILAEALEYFAQADEYVQQGRQCLRELAKCDLIERPSTSELLLEAAAIMADQEASAKKEK